jgi:MFS family permease
LIAQWSVSAALAFDALTFILSFCALSLTHKRALSTVTEERTAPRYAGFMHQWKELFAGLRFLRGEKGVLTLVLFFSLINGLNNVEAVLVPHLARVDLGLSATQFGLFATAMGVGTLLGALVAGLVGSRVRRRAQVICLSMLVFGGAIALMGTAQDAQALYAAYALLGVSFIVPQVIWSTFLQHIVPAAMRGRVFGFTSLIAMAMNPLGLLLAGVLGDSVGARAGLWIGGGSIVILSLLALSLPAVRGLNRRGVTPDAEVAPVLDAAQA